jgi:hypothetical protein
MALRRGNAYIEIQQRLVLVAKTIGKMSHTIQQEVPFLLPKGSLGKSRTRTTRPRGCRKNADRKGESGREQHKGIARMSVSRRVRDNIAR